MEEQRGERGATRRVEMENNGRMGTGESAVRKFRRLNGTEKEKDGN